MSQNGWNPASAATGVPGCSALRWPTRNPETKRAPPARIATTTIAMARIGVRALDARGRTVVVGTSRAGGDAGIDAGGASGGVDAGSGVNGSFGSIECEVLR